MTPGPAQKDAEGTPPARYPLRYIRRLNTVHQNVDRALARKLWHRAVRHGPPMQHGAGRLVCKPRSALATFMRPPGHIPSVRIHSNARPRSPTHAAPPALVQGHPMNTITVAPDLALKPLQQGDAKSLFTLIQANRSHLRRWLTWVDANTELDHTRRFIESALAQAAGQPWPDLRHMGQRRDRRRHRLPSYRSGQRFRTDRILARRSIHRSGDHDAILQRRA